MKPLNSIVAACPPSGIRRFFDIAANMDSVISLGVGEPDFTTPWNVREAAIYAFEHGYTNYTSNAGLIELREAVCLDLERRCGASYQPDGECLITSGVSQGLDIALRALLDAGDEVIIPEPCYVAYGPCVSFAGGVPVLVPSADSAFQVDVDAIEAAVTERTKAILVASPANPTGAVQTIDSLTALVELAVRHDLYIVSDEIYEQLVYGVPHVSVPSLPGARDRTVLLGGFSKAYAMTGWRVGYLCAPAEIVELAGRIHQYTMLCAPHVSQLAALEALRGGREEVTEMVVDYDRRRRFFVKGLNDLGLSCEEPHGAFYAFPSVASTGLSSDEFAERLLVEQRVAVVPGHVFGPSGEGHVRCCYATALPLIEEALERMDRFLSTLR
ncbi:MULTISPECIES: aminotransferase class I/II-fold pyridoxal phosphate-dependent enzyme [unclassified Pseudofrankia]|uniref:aminotransferase class I/II-fold pyridoxal phosphate-dependent enzyme n=1 Tax=unclassified Pseudofrankia TaxID=2994372 RepID=UPI0008D93353|nr:MULTISPECIES: aminotransferase class I/II-fold pyridoxal phosphate-dependent enzyme [unclassified Pseudofrankia]MDT3438518.1 aminotransferase class I/II-fold pyridoxal phosphate-dependent enzyme [Pseudofrankia sp. BMG5.37]OHV49729.1 aromatic amino acid aminotransferase [Pseudofrankia sp. BMG5.36]